MHHSPSLGRCRVRHAGASLSGDATESVVLQKRVVATSAAFRVHLRFVLSLYDSTFECIAEGHASACGGPPQQALWG